MTYDGNRQYPYSDEEVADALDALANDRGLESRFAAMRIVIVEGLEAAGFLKPITRVDIKDMLSDDVIIR